MQVSCQPLCLLCSARTAGARLQSRAEQSGAPRPAASHPAGNWTVLAGGEGQPGFRNGPGQQALLSSPTGLCQMPHGRLAVADSGNACIRSIDTTTGTVSTLAGACGERPGHEDGPAAEARFGSSIKSIVCLANCSVLVGDVGTGRLRCTPITDLCWRCCFYFNLKVFHPCFHG